MIARIDTRMRTIVRTAAVSAAAGALVAAMLLPGTALAASSNRTWNVTAGAQSPDAGLQANFFFTNKITINMGDSVKWTSQAGEIHTVTFVPPGSPTPSLETEGPLPTGGSSYNGTALVDSGFLAIKGNPSKFADTYSLSFPKPGTYNYICLVHSQMKGTVEVLPQNEKPPRTQASYDAEANIGRAVALGEAGINAARGFQAGAAPNKVTVGIGQLFTGLGSVAVMRFLPSQKVTHVNQTVTWTNLDPETPHTVTFGLEPSPGNPFGNFPPVGEDSPGHATINLSTVTAHSGFIGNPQSGFLGTTFSATFTQAGTYKYICALHDDLGMVGSITVLP
jgi:plastocyanin